MVLKIKKGFQIFLLIERSWYPVKLKKQKNLNTCTCILKWISLKIFYTGNFQANFVIVDSWINCNDSKVKLCSKEEVLLSQGYILVYTKNVLGQLSPLDSFREQTLPTDDYRSENFSKAVDEDITFNFKSPVTEETNGKSKKRNYNTSGLQTEHRIIKRRRSTIW